MTKHQLLIVIVAALACIASACQKPAARENDVAQTGEVNNLTEKEKSEGWQLLFDGTTLNGWKRYNQDTIGPLWSVENGAIVCDGKGLAEGTPGVGGSLMTVRQFGNFELSIDWKISPGGNSGILYHVVERPEYAHDYETGPEYQVMDDAGWKGDSIRPEQMAASNYDMYAASADKKLKPVGEWNTARIVYKDGHVEHWLNGEKVVEFEEASEDFATRYQNSKWKGYPGWNKFKTGSISLQDHGSPVYYRNIKIREL